MTKLSGAASASMLVLLVAAPVHAKKCPLDSVQVGGLCVDKYEASVWEIPATSAGVINAVKKGKVLAAASLGGATQRGTASADYGSACPLTGSGCTSDYAVSIP